ncbi:phage protease [Pararhizobium sp. BT-229]|uniref:phage protease n=1 Tax=Pararhizobium sp. BT-229 TaxID=2986923 RepID=UPI0021F6C690|nr:phage protease [Pararhizobium sp. BT-229]MCV9966353.1 phage protease [Pararhizobium sp. BT-229]
MTNTAILNSIDLPGAIGTDNIQWVHILPAGESYSRDGRGPWKLANPQAVLAATQAYHRNTKMVVDYDHQTVFAAVPKVGGNAPAAGWVVETESRGDGIWAKVEWTAAAAQKIREKTYRYISPVFRHLASGEIVSILNVALTNTPALELTALAAAEISMDLEAQMAGLRALLGLPTTADYGAISAAISALQAAQAATASVKPDPSQFVPMAEFTRVVQEANSLRQGVTLSAATTYVEEQIRAGKIVPYMKDWAIGLCSVNKPELDRFITTTGPAFNHLLSSQLPTVYPKHGGSTGKLDESEQAVCNTLGLTEEQFIGARKSVENAAE